MLVRLDMPFTNKLCHRSAKVVIVKGVSEANNVTFGPTQVHAFYQVANSNLVPNSRVENRDRSHSDKVKVTYGVIPGKSRVGAIPDAEPVKV